MLRPVWPSHYFWYFLGFFSSFLWLFSAYNMDIFKKRGTEILVGIVLNLTLFFSWFVGNIMLSQFFLIMLSNPNSDNLFHGRKRLGKIIGAALICFGNILVHYFSENSTACMLTFLFLAIFCHCVLCYIQPYTDFGVLGFLLSASLNRALSLFGLKIYTWLVLFACMVIVGLRYLVKPLAEDEDEKSELKLQGGS